MCTDLEAAMDIPGVSPGSLLIDPGSEIGVWDSGKYYRNTTWLV